MAKVKFVLSRRALITSGTVVAVAGVVAGIIGFKQVDELANWLGVDPRRLPDPADEELRKAVVTDESRILAALKSNPAFAEMAALSEQHLARLGEVEDVRPQSAPIDSILAEAVNSRKQDALDARSSSFAMVLTSIAASHEQQRRWIKEHP